MISSKNLKILKVYNLTISLLSHCERNSNSNSNSKKVSKELYSKVVGFPFSLTFAAHGSVNSMLKKQCFLTVPYL